MTRHFDYRHEKRDWAIITWVAGLSQVALAILAATCLSGCDGPDYFIAAQMHRNLKRIVFVRDERTGLCFGAVDSAKMILVPCDPVRDLLK